MLLKDTFLISCQASSHESHSFCVVLRANMWSNLFCFIFELGKCSLSNLFFNNQVHLIIVNTLTCGKTNTGSNAGVKKSSQKQSSALCWACAHQGKTHTRNCTVGGGGGGGGVWCGGGSGVGGGAGGGGW